MKRKHKVTVSTHLPLTTWRLLNQGIRIAQPDLIARLSEIQNAALVKYHHETIELAIKEIEKLRKKSK